VSQQTEQLRTRAAETLLRSRARTTALTTLDEGELTAQHSPLMSPLVWDLAHIGNQEELWLVRDVGGRAPLREDIDQLYDAFVHSRASRPSLPLLSPTQARGYVNTVREKVLDILDSAALSGDRLRENAFAFGMIAQHEQQHAETMLATHQLRTGGPALSAAPSPQRGTALPAEAVIPAGEFTMGTDIEPWALDNERSAHPVYLPAYAIDTTPVTNAQYQSFIAADGYQRAELWTTVGWAHRQQAGLRAPQFWQQDTDGRWWRRRFGIREPVPDAEPVMHVCFHEAQAYARWAGRRLPTEAEWEKAARYDPHSGRSRRYPWGDEAPTAERANLGQCHLQPAAVGSYPAGASATGVHQLIGDVWEWCDSGFHPYPDFEVFPYAEYSQVFFGGDYRMLRGGSFGADEVVARSTFRNWDHPIRRQIFAGFRCARDLTVAERG